MKTLKTSTIIFSFVLLTSCHGTTKKPKSVQNQIEILQKQSDSLSEYRTLLLREYSYDGAQGKMSRDEAWERAEYMKSITAKRMVIEHKIDSLKLLSRPKK